MSTKPASPTLFILIIFAGAILILGGVGFSLVNGSAKGNSTLATSLETSVGGDLFPIPNSAKAPYALMTKSDRDQQLLEIDKRRGSRVLIPSVRALVALNGNDTYLTLYANPGDGFLYFIESKGAEGKPLRYWAMNIQSPTFHSLRTVPPIFGILSPGENLVAYATAGDARGELHELHVLSLPLDIEKTLVVLGGSETLTVSKNKYTNEPQAKLSWKNDKTVGFGVTSSEFPIGEGRPVSETREVQVR